MSYQARTIGFAILCVIAVTSGCGNRAESGTQTVASNTAPAHAAPMNASDEDKVKQFLTALESQPSNERGKYVNAHQAEATLAAQSKDPAISQRFYSLMMPKLVGANK